MGATNERGLAAAVFSDSLLERVLSAPGKGQNFNLMFSHILNGFQKYCCCLAPVFKQCGEAAVAARSYIPSALGCGLWKSCMQPAKPNLAALLMRASSREKRGIDRALAFQVQLKEPNN